MRVGMHTQTHTSLMFTQSVLLQNRAPQAFLFNALNGLEYSLNIIFKMRKQAQKC